MPWKNRIRIWLPRILVLVWVYLLALWAFEATGHCFASDGFPRACGPKDAYVSLGHGISTFLNSPVFLVVIFGGAKKAAIPYAVGLYITAAYWFTSSTSFANPAVTLARSLSNTFAGIAPASVPQEMMHESFHQREPSPLSSGMINLETTKVSPMETNEVSHTREVSGASKFISSALP